MTFPKTTTPSINPEPVSQYGEDDPYSQTTPIWYLYAGCALILANFAVMHFTNLPAAKLPIGPQCAGYEELAAAPVNVSGFQELDAPDCG